MAWQEFLGKSNVHLNVDLCFCAIILFGHCTIKSELVPERFVVPLTIGLIVIKVEADLQQPSKLQSQRSPVVCLQCIYCEKEEAGRSLQEKIISWKALSCQSFTNSNTKLLRLIMETNITFEEFCNTPDEPILGLVKMETICYWEVLCAEIFLKNVQGTLPTTLIFFLQTKNTFEWFLLLCISSFVGENIYTN